MRSRGGRLALTAAPAVLLTTLFACSDDDPPGATSDDAATPSPDDAAAAGEEAISRKDGAPEPQDSQPDPFVTVTSETMSFGGKTRSYLLAKPVSYDDAKSYPLVMSFHGNPSSAAAVAQHIPFDAASKEEAVIVYPQADTDSWDLYTPTDSNADMDFIHALPAEVKTKANVDLARVYGFGYSGGGFFLTQFTCRFGDVFKAISVNAGGGPDEPQMGYAQHENGCYVCPGGPVAILVTHGDADTSVEPASGDFTRVCYATTNGCGETLSPTTPAPCQTYDACPTGSPVTWCLIPGQGHGVWSKATTEAWAFFQDVP